MVECSQDQQRRNHRSVSDEGTSSLCGGPSSLYGVQPRYLAKAQPRQFAQTEQLVQPRQHALSSMLETLLG